MAATLTDLIADARPMPQALDDTVRTAARTLTKACRHLGLPADAHLAYGIGMLTHAVQHEPDMITAYAELVATRAPRVARPHDDILAGAIDQLCKAAALRTTLLARQGSPTVIDTPLAGATLSVGGDAGPALTTYARSVHVLQRTP